MKTDYAIYLFLSVCWLIVLTLLYVSYIITQPDMNVVFVVGSIGYALLSYGLVRIIVHTIFNIKKNKGEKKDE